MKELLSGRFRLVKQLGRGGMGIVYEAYDCENDAVVAIKTMRDADATALFRFKHEFRALADVQHPNLLRLGELYSDGGEWFFTMELVRGATFQQYVRLDRGAPRTPGSGGSPGSGGTPGSGGSPGSGSAGSSRSSGNSGSPTEPEGETMPTVQLRGRPTADPASPGAAAATPPAPLEPRGFDEAKLRDAARQLASALGALHGAGRIHRDVKPSNVLVREDGHLVLLDFGLITERTAPHAESVEVSAGTPAYMAPEQARPGPVGPEADWYSFGVVLFLALTGHHPTPFGAGAVGRGRTPSDFVAEVPADLDDLCRGLLQRDPHARPTGDQVIAILGGRPVDAAPVSAFVGRDAELAELTRSYDRVRAGGTEIVLVEGEPGIGKSALVHRFLDGHVLSDPAAVLLAGRCYEQESVPFKGFDSLIDGLSAHLAELDDTEVDALLAAGVGFLAGIFPVLARVPAIARRVVGSAASPALDNPQARRAQAFHELRALLAALAVRGPLVLYLDDLQWADRESLALLEALFAPARTPASLLVATRRPPPPGASPTVLPGIDPARIHRIALGRLSDGESRTLWEALGGRSRALVREASGHPLFLAELVRYARTVPEGLAPDARLQDVLGVRVDELEPAARAFMEAVALAGAPMRYQILAEAAAIPTDEALPLIGTLRAAQLVKIDRRGDERLVEPYHDRMREAIAERLADGAGHPAPRALDLRLRLGRSLLAHTAASDLPSAVFAIVSHLNAAAAAIDTASERRRLAELNLLAGKQARLATAYDAALEYLDRGLALVGHAEGERAGAEDPHAALGQELAREHVMAAYLAGRPDTGRAELQALLARVRTDEERADLDVFRIGLETGGSCFAEAITAAREGLRRLGVTLPTKPGTAAILREYAAVRWHQGRRPIAELADLPDLHDPRQRDVTRLLVAMAPACFFVDTALMTTCLLRLARLSFAHGLSAASSYGIAGYGAVLGGAFGKHADAYALGQLALRLNERFADHQLDSKLHFINGTYITPWVRPFAQAKAQLVDAQAAGLRYGDLAYEAYAAATLSVISYCEAARLDGMQACAEASREVTARRRDEDMTALVTTHARYCAALRGLPGASRDLYVPDGAGPSGSPSSDAPFRPAVSDERTPVASFYHHFQNAELAWFFGDLAKAAACHAEATKRIAGIFSVPTGVELEFLGVLIEAGEYPRASRRRRVALAWSLSRRVRKLRRWAAVCPANFAAHWRIAEAARARGASGANAAFALAIATAREHGSLKREAIALELAARCHAQQGAVTEANELRQAAIAAYRQWGAAAKADSLVA